MISLSGSRIAFAAHPGYFSAARRVHTFSCIVRRSSSSVTLRTLDEPAAGSFVAQVVPVQVPPQQPRKNPSYCAMSF
jgi:hypothetical protein